MLIMLLIAAAAQLSISDLHSVMSNAEELMAVPPFNARRGASLRKAPRVDQH